MKRLWITGADGFVGQTFTREASHSQFTADAMLLTGLPAFDLRDTAAVRDAVALARPDWVIHLAAISFVPEAIADPETCFDVNFAGTHHLLRALQASGFSGRLLYVSSADVYGITAESQLPVTEINAIAPRNPYAVSKACAEIMCQQWARTAAMDIVIARPFNHVGRGQRDDFVLTSAARQIARIKAGLQTGDIQLGDTAVTRDFSDVRDVVRAYVALLDAGRTGEIYNVCSGVERSVDAVIARMLELSDVDVQVRQNAQHMRRSEQRRAVGSANKLRIDTGWYPQIPWDETLREIIEDWQVRINE